MPLAASEELLRASVLAVKRLCLDTAGLLPLQELAKSCTSTVQRSVDGADKCASPDVSLQSLLTTTLQSIHTRDLLQTIRDQGKPVVYGQICPSAPPQAGCMDS